MVDDSDADAAAAGWYPDPAGSDQERRWTGTEWTPELREKQGSATASATPLIGQQLRKSQAAKLVSRLDSRLYKGEVLEALYWAVGVRTPVNALAITNARVLALSSGRSTERLVSVEACGPEIARAETVRGRLGSRMLKVTTSPSAEPLHFGSVRPEDADEIVRRIDQLRQADLPASVAEAIRLAAEEQSGTLAAQLGSETADPERDGVEQAHSAESPAGSEVATQEQVISLVNAMTQLIARASEAHVPKDARVGTLAGAEIVKRAGRAESELADAEVAKRAEAGRAERANVAGQQVARRMIGKVSKKGLEEIDNHCRPEEVPKFIIGSGTGGALAAFEDRCLIVKKGGMTSFMTGALGGGRVTTFMYAQITGIEYNSGFVSGVLEILTPSYQGSANKDYWRGTARSRNADSNDPFTLSNTLPLSKQEHELARPLIDELRKLIAQAHQPVVRIETSQHLSSDGESGLAAELEKLAALHANGVLDQDEYRAAKAALIAKAGT